MLRRFRDLSIRQKLTLVVMCTCCVAVVITCVAFLAIDVLKYRETKVQEMSSLARVLGASSRAALAFSDKDAAEKTLSALADQRDVLSAQVYDREGTPFAEYLAAGTVPSPGAVLTDGHRFEGDRLVLFKPIVLDGEAIGTFRIECDAAEIRARLMRYFTISIAVVIIVLAVAFLLSQALQRSVSRPILRLASTTREISVGKDYSVRVPKESNDEIGMLVDGFNEMLGQIQSQDQTIRANESYVRNLLDSISVGVVVVDAQTHEILDVNRAGGDMIGTKREKMIGKVCHGFMCPARKGKCPVTDLGQGVDHSERVMLRADGSRVPILKSVVRIEREGRECLLESFIDITNLKMAEDQIRHRLALETAVAQATRMLVSSTGDSTLDVLGVLGDGMNADRACIFRLDGEQNSMQRMYAWCREGPEASEETEAGDTVDVPFSWLERLRNGENVLVSCPISSADGETDVAEFLAAHTVRSFAGIPTRSADGELSGMIGFGRCEKHPWSEEDTGALKAVAEMFAIVEKRDKAEEKLRRAQSELYTRDKLASVGQLAAGIAHELNNPIGFVLNNFYALKENVKVFKECLVDYRAIADDASKLEAFADAVRQLKQKEEDLQFDFILEDLDELFSDSEEGFHRATAIIDSMRDFSRTDQVGLLAMHDINDSVESTLVIAKNEYKYCCEIEMQLGEVPKVMCQPNQLNQVLLNIIVNAAHAIASQNRDGQGHVCIKTFEAEDHVCCDISDDGPGIPAGVRSRIFDPFFTTKEPGKGTGLGLSISYDIVVEKHGGEFIVESAEGEGTTFRICLPKTRPEEADDDERGFVL